MALFLVMAQMIFQSKMKALLLKLCKYQCCRGKITTNLFYSYLYNSGGNKGINQKRALKTNPLQIFKAQGYKAYK